MPRPVAAAKARQGVAPLPFELVVLEVALGDVCNVLQRLTKELELLAHPALEALTRDVRGGPLEPCGSQMSARCRAAAGGGADARSACG